MYVKSRTTCRVSGKPLKQLADLGNLHLSHFYKEKELDAPRGPLRIGIGEESGLLQLMDTVDRDLMYRKYWYLSGTNSTMTQQLRDIVSVVPYWIRLKDGDVVLDIGCNDGTLLSQYPLGAKLVKVGIDPAMNIAERGKASCDFHACDYFKKETFDNLTEGRKAKVITSIAMFYDLEDPTEFIRDIYDCLDDDGIWIMQLSYTPLMLKQNAFDNIIHEHLAYYSLISIDFLLKKFEMKILDVEFNDTNAGSFRLVVAKTSNPVKDAALFNKDIGAYRYASTYEYEKKMGVDQEGLFLEFIKRVKSIKSETLDMLSQLKKQGKKVFGYGASTKGNTLLQYYGLDSSLVQGIAERQPQKFGMLTPGSWIPIISEEEMRKQRPDYLLVLPWHFFNEFYLREKDFLKSGGKYIVPLPELQVIG